MSADADTLRILRERARALARRDVSPVEGGRTIEVLELRLASERYAVETRFVIEVQPLRDLTPLPATPAFVRGIVNLRGRILPVYDLKKFFGLPEPGLTDLHRIVVVSAGEFEIGLLADVVTGVRRLALDALSPALPTNSAIAADYLRGITDEHVVVLDLARILSDPGIVVNDGDNE